MKRLILRERVSQLEERSGVLSPVRLFMEAEIDYLLDLN
jgi:hypothetical protein